MPVNFDLDYTGVPLTPPREVIDEGFRSWSEFLVGFFLGGSMNI